MDHGCAARSVLSNAKHVLNTDLNTEFTVASPCYAECVENKSKPNEEKAPCPLSWKSPE